MSTDVSSIEEGNYMGNWKNNEKFPLELKITNKEDLSNNNLFVENFFLKLK